MPSVVFGEVECNTNKLITCDGVDCNYDQFMCTFSNLITFALKIAFACLVLAFVFAGYLYLTSGGDSGKVKRAHTMFKNIAIGLIFTMLAFGLVKLLLTTLGFDFGTFNVLFK